MKLTAQKYTSPLPNQGTFENVTIQDVAICHKRFDKYLSIEFEMSYENNNNKVILASVIMGFFGMEGDNFSSNRTTTISIPNPDYDSNIEGSESRITVPMFDYIMQHGMPTDYVVVDYGYPTYEKVMQYFSGGTLSSPEISITNPLAIGFILTNLVINGEIAGNQFLV
jgi:hypothetical protein